MAVSDDIMICDCWEICGREEGCYHERPHERQAGCTDKCVHRGGIPDSNCIIATDELRVYATMVLAGGKR